MTITKIYYSSHFFKAFKGLSQDIQNRAIVQEKIFRKNCFDPRLKTHKLKDRLKNYWSFSITHKTRIMFEFLERGEVGFIDIDDHNIYRNI